MVKAYVLLKVGAGKEREIVHKLECIKEVIDVNELYGDWDVIAKLQLDSLDQLDSILTERIRSISSIEKTSTMIVAEYLK